MKNTIINNRILNSFILSYSQIFFSTNRILGIILLLVSLMDVWSGLFGAFSVLVSLFIARRLGFDKKTTDLGVYSYNSLLTGLGIGLYFAPSISLLIYTFVVSLVVLFLSVAIAKYLATYGLPFLSIPFLLGIWMVDLSASSFQSLGLSDRGIFDINQIYGLGGNWLLSFYNWVSTVPILYSLEVYFLSLGAIFFQYQVVAGMIIAIGLLIHSRITFLLSLIGFYAAWLFYFILGASLYDLSYSYIGFNFILTAVALGGFYLIPNKYSFGWMLLILPLVVLVTIASIGLFSHFNIGIYALPFNLVVILFIYVNKLRYKDKYELKEVVVQHASPEKNLYFSTQSEQRFVELKYVPMGLPVTGEWAISQAHNGSITHQGKWKHAWDFIITNMQKEQFNGSGNFVSDYFCYEKNVVAAYQGVVQEIADGIEDNTIGENNLRNNWGNTIIIKHTDLLYSKYSHLKKGSFSVKKGDWIKKGQVIAKVGNSGRSPYPHLHFQLQSTPYIGSETIAFPLASYLSKNQQNKYHLHLYDFPKEDEKIQKPEINKLMAQALKWEIGRELIFDIEQNGEKYLCKWQIKSDLYKNTYIYSEKSDAYAYFYSDNELCYFKNYHGSKTAPLYQFFLAFNKMHQSFYSGVVLNDNIALHLSQHQKWHRFIQDFIAPFHIFLRTKYQLEYLEMDDELSPSLLKLKSSIKYFYHKKEVKKQEYDIQIKERGLIEIRNEKANFHAIQKLK